jgi:hypothetical protein
MNSSCAKAPLNSKAADSSNVAVFMGVLPLNRTC